MPKLSDLIPYMSKVLGVPKTSVAVVARHARAADMISKGGRGPGGAEMSTTDCVNLLLGVIYARNGGYSKDVGDGISMLRNMPKGNFGEYTPIEIKKYVNTFGESIDYFISKNHNISISVACVGSTYHGRIHWYTEKDNYNSYSLISKFPIYYGNDNSNGFPNAINDRINLISITTVSVITFKWLSSFIDEFDNNKEKFL